MRRVLYDKRKAHLARSQLPIGKPAQKEELCIRVERLTMSTDFKASAELIKVWADWRGLSGRRQKETERCAGAGSGAAMRSLSGARRCSTKLDQRRAGNQKKERSASKAEELANRENIAQDTAEAELKRTDGDWRRIGPAPH